MNKMNIGNEYKVIGIPTCVKTSQTAVCVEANSITFCIPKGKENVNIILTILASLNPFVQETSIGCLCAGHSSKH